ncbi:class I SAM-dependent methyltransferase [Pseudoramibacter faecis]|uniref:class I SAM-dependent methyltransferase n=1 Tax=Pseudoramibacter faecis TaxID=3108534 RepID=UPI002E78ECF1|nr:methyltransferase domain-containing protein [Pseudoramibacter sp. HA2172]
MKANWTAILNKYIHKLVSPDGRQTYESKPDLVNLILELAKLQKTDKVIDLGCGWGNFLKVCSNFSGEVIGIEPNSDNLKEAANRSGGKNIKYIQGSFENLNYKDRVNKIISMLAFHQVPWDDKEKALKNISEVLAQDGYFFLCDTMILFDPEDDPERFDKVYRYLLKETTPDEIYIKDIEPYLVDSEVYTVNDMRENSPKDNWFYSIKEVESWAEHTALKLVKTIELCPFFGVAVFQKKIK